MVVPVGPSVVFVAKATVGLIEVLQTKPLTVTGYSGSMYVIFPPPVALLAPIEVIVGLVVTVTDVLCVVNIC